MSKNSLQKVLLRKLGILIISVNIILSLILGIIIRKYTIKTSISKYERQIKTATTQINNKLQINYDKIQIISEIVLSQIDYPRATYNFNSMFSGILSSNTEMENLFITLTPNTILATPQLQPFTDSIGRFNVSWKKGINEIVFIDSINYERNNYYYETIKNQLNAKYFKTNTTRNINEITASKDIVLPLFIGTKFVGIMGYTINFKYLKNILEKNQINKNTFIADENGKILFNNGKNYEIGNNCSNILPEEFKNKELEILHNNNFIQHQNNKILIFKSFPTQFNNQWKIGVTINTGTIYNKANLYFIITIIAFILLSIIAIIVINTAIKKGLFFINSLSESITNLKNGKIKQPVKILTNFSEINKLTTNISTLKKRLEELSQMHYNLSKQKLKTRMKAISEKDEIANSINIAINSIEQRVAKREKALEIEKKNDWITEGLNLIHEAAKITNDSIEQLSDKINEKITVFSDAFISSIFIYTQKENQKPILKTISTFGINKKRAFNRKIEPGVGVIGSVAMEQKTQYYDKIPKDYHIIIGGLGEMQPKSILVQALKYEDKFYGILEIAFLRKLQTHELNFFEIASSEIALALKNIINNIETKELLDKMKTQTTEIEKTQKMLQQKIKELSKKEKEAKINHIITQSILNAVNNTLMTIEYSPEGILLSANKKYLNLMNYTLSEIKGVNVLDLVKTERQELATIIKKVAEGKNHEKIVKRFTKYGEIKWLYSTYTPYFDINKKVTKIIYFAFDITETKKYTEKLEKK